MRSHDPRDGRCLRLRGLPFGVTKAQVAAFLNPCAVAERIVLCIRDGKCTGHAFVICATAAQAAHAFSALNKQRLGHRYIEVFNALPREVDAAAAGNSDYEGATDGRASSSSSAAPRPPGGTLTGPMCSTPTSSNMWEGSGQQPQQQHRPVVRVRGVPRGVPPTALAEWLLPARCFRGGSRSIHYDLDESGFFTGEALVELADMPSLEIALTKNGQLLGASPVLIEPSDQAALLAHLGPLAAATGSDSGSGGGAAAYGSGPQQLMSAQPPPPLRASGLRQVPAQWQQPPPQLAQLQQQQQPQMMQPGGYSVQAPNPLMLAPACTQYEEGTSAYYQGPELAAAPRPMYPGGWGAPPTNAAPPAHPTLVPAIGWPQPPQQPLLMVPQARPQYLMQPPQLPAQQHLGPGHWHQHHQQQQLQHHHHHHHHQQQQQQQQQSYQPQQLQRRYTAAGDNNTEATFGPEPALRRQTD